MVAIEFAFNFQNIRNHDYIASEKGMEIQVNEPVIGRISRLPMGMP